MSTGKHLSLEEARKKKLLKRFAKEHKSKGNEKAFDELLDNMAKSSAKDEETSKKN